MQKYYINRVFLRRVFFFKLKDNFNQRKLVNKSMVGPIKPDTVSCMMMLRPTLVLLMVVLMLIPEEGEGWFFRRRRRRWRRYHVRTSHNINNCHCNKIHADLIKLLRDVLKSRRRLGRREVSTMLDVDEDDPLLEEFMQNSMDKRKYVIRRMRNSA